MMVVPFDGEAGVARRLFDPEVPIDFISARGFGRSYDVARDGRFIAPRQVLRPPITSLRVVMGAAGARQGS